MSSKSFESPEEMAEYQSNSAVLEALRVQLMSSEERFEWLQYSWGRLQDDATILFLDGLGRPGTSRCFTSFEEKNKFNEDLEIADALLRNHGAPRS